MSYLDVPTASGISTPDDPRYAIATVGSVNGTFWFTGRLALDNWATGVAQAIINQYIAAAGAGSRFWFGINSANAFEYRFYNTGGVITATCVAQGWLAGSDHWLQVIHNLNAGTVNFRTSSDGVSFIDMVTQVSGLAATAQATTGTAPVIRIGTDADNKHAPGHYSFTKVQINSTQVFNKDWVQERPGTTGPWSDPNVAGSASVGEVWTRIGTASIQGILQIVEPAAPASPVSVLGCGIASAEIWTRGGGERVLALPNISAASWDRVLSDTSAGEVTLPGSVLSADPACCETLADVRPWKHELHIYRDDKLGWCGPITFMDIQKDDLVIKARDLSAWLDRRVVHKAHVYGGQGPGQGDTITTTIFSDLVTDAFEPDPSPNVTLEAGATSGVFAQGSYTPSAFKTVGPLIRELAKGSIDWYVVNRTLRYSGGGVTLPGAPGGGLDVTALCVANPGLETNTSNWTVAGTGWSIARDTTQHHAGGASLKASNASDPPKGFRITQPLSGLIVGKTYKASIWARGGTLITHPDAYWGGVRGMQISVAGSLGADISYALLNAPTTWMQVSVTFIADATTATLQIDTGSGLDGEWSGTLWIFKDMYFDDVTLVLVNPDAGTAIPAGSTQAAALYLNDDDLAMPPKLSLDGLSQETRSIVSGQLSGGDSAFYGEAPQPTWVLNSTGPGLTTAQTEFGLLEGATLASGADSSSAEAQASQRQQYLSDTPVVISELALGPQAGVLMSDLVPGTLIDVRLDRVCILPFRRILLLRKVNVKTTASGGEEITLSFDPFGGA